jgi:hypothetical protein
MCEQLCLPGCQESEGNYKTPTRGCGVWYWVSRENGEICIWHCNRPRCHRLCCIQCWKNARIALLCNLVIEYDLRRFFTLTLDRNLTLEEAWRRIPFTWSKMRKRLARIAKKRSGVFLFVAVLESHKDSYPHIHGFTNLWLEQSIWSNLWEECGGGKVTHVEYVRDTAYVGEYLTKQIEVGRYVGKENLANALQHLSKHSRTIWRSLNMKTLFEEEKANREKSKWHLSRSYNKDGYAQQQGRIPCAILKAGIAIYDETHNERVQAKRRKTQYEGHKFTTTEKGLIEYVNQKKAQWRRKINGKKTN